jgi:hypothetical protein
MKKSSYFLALYGCLWGSATATIQEVVLSRGDSIPVESFEHATDPYLEGYIQALIDMHYYDYQVIVTVKDHKVYLSNLPKNDLTANSIISFVKDLPGVESVEVEKELPPEEKSVRRQYTERPQVNGIWFPQSTVLFPPLVADPRQPVNSVNLRYGDSVVGKRTVAVSLGDDFPIFRWREVMRWCGDLQIGIEAGIWAVFNFSHPSDKDNGDVCELVNTDYFVGIPLTYAFDQWSFRFRLYHISGHLGDEFLVDHKKFLHKRKNPSIEAIDFFSSYQFSTGVRAYFGPGVVFHSDNSFSIKPLYIQYGIEVRLFGKKYHFHKLYGTPFFAANIENWQQHHWNFNAAFKLGYEWSKLQGVGRKMRVYVDYYTGFSYEGQFFNKRTSYGEFGISWGF